MPKTFERLSDGKLPHSSWPGLYPLMYLLADGAVICAGCANGENGSEASAEPGTDPQWHIVDQFIYWEGEPMDCDHCNAPIESAYGEVQDAAEMDLTEEQKQFDLFYGPADHYLNS